MQSKQALVDPPGSYQELCDRLGFAAGIPYVDDWSAAADFLQLITDAVLVHQPAAIVECGSGLSTLMLARVCQIARCGHVYSLENSEPHAMASRESLDHYALADYATVIYAPLTSYRVHGGDYQWYETDKLPDHEVGMLVIDGPPGRLQKHSRYPALPLLYDRLSSGGTVYMDDASRPDEREIVSLWQNKFPGVSNEYIDTQRGCARLRVDKS